MKSPFDYAGFVGDGISDDAAPLQAALDDTSENWLDFSNVVQAKITAPLVLSRPKIITGLRSAINFTQAASGTAQPAFKTAPGAEGSRISGLKINYGWGSGITPDAAFSGMVGAVSIECEDVTLHDLTIDGNKGGAAPGVRLSGIEIKAGSLLIDNPNISNVSGYGIHALTAYSVWPSSIHDIAIRRGLITNIGDGFGVGLLNVNGNMSGIKIEGVTVDMSAELANSAKNAIFVGSMDAIHSTRDVLISGCKVLSTWEPDNTANGSITLATVIGGRTIGNYVNGGGIGISQAYGYDNTVVGNTIAMNGAYNVAQGRIGYGIEIAGSEVACVGNSIEGHGNLPRGIAIQCAVPIYNVNVGPNNIQGCTTRIFQQGAHPGPFRVLDP